MIGDTFVFDAVFHFNDFSGEGLRDDVPRMQTAELTAALRVLSRLTGGVADLTKYWGENDYEFPAELRGSLDAVFDLVKNSPTDMIMAGNAPFLPSEMHKDPEHQMRMVAAFVKAHPERAVFGGGTDPHGTGMGLSRPLGLNFALESIEYQISELGARSMKFYPFTWTCDDEKLAYPMYEKCRALGVNLIQVHKNVSAFLEDVEWQRPNDLQAAARDFPDMTFLMHHPMRLYFEETVNIAQRFPNIHLLLSPLIHFLAVTPRMALEQLGYLLQQVGSDKLIWGSEGLIVGNPTRYIEAFMEAEMPQDLRDGYGYPQITKADKENILGLNFARLLGIDVETKQKELAALPAGR